MNDTWPDPESAGYAISQLARKTDDRSRDIGEELRAAIIDKLSPYKWSGHYIKYIKEAVALEWEDEKEVFGESLPVGLYIEN